LAKIMTSTDIVTKFLCKIAIVKNNKVSILVYKQRRFDSHSVSERLFSYSFSLLLNPIFVQRNNGVSVLYRSAIFALRKGKISYGNDQAGKCK